MALNDLVADNGSVKRLGAFVVTAGVVALNKKLGLDLDTGTIGALVALALGFITQSMVKEKADATGKAAAEAVTSVSDAAAVLGGSVVAAVKP